MRWLSHKVMVVLGWRFEGRIPHIPKMVVIGAPHTSNWDFFIFLAALHHFNIRARFLGKHTLFRWPFGWMFRKMGGIPVDRSRPGGVVDDAKRAFETHESLTLVIAPEGTRRATTTWKSGFVEIAEAARVPVVCAAIDSAAKAVVIGPAISVGKDRRDLMDRVRAFYKDKHGIIPENKGPVTLTDETPPPTSPPDA